MRKKDNWYQVVIPTEHGFEFKEVPDLRKAKLILEQASKSQKKFFEDSINEVADHYDDIVEFLKPMALQNRALLKVRMKDPESLRKKILDRTVEYQHRGHFYRLTDLHDTVGGRLVVDLSSRLYFFNRNKRDWARALKIRPDQILDIDLKGNSKECAKEKCYRAVHLLIRHDSGVKFELQILSKAVNHWHKWDHEHVYKNNEIPKEEWSHLKSYSLAWLRTIRILEDMQMGQATFADLKALHPESGIDFTWTNWPRILDDHLTRMYGISYKDRFLVEPVDGKYTMWNRRHLRAERDLQLLSPVEGGK